MDCAEVIALDEVHARKHWTTLRQWLHERFDRWLDKLDGHLSKQQPILPDVTQAVWNLRQSLPGSVTEAIIVQTYQDAANQPYACCPQCEHCVKSRGTCPRRLETLVG